MKFIKKQFWMSLIMMLIFNITMVAIVSMIKVTRAPTEPYFYVSPSEVKNKLPKEIFVIRIYVANAPSTYAWEVHFRWNSSLLRWYYKLEGDFLKRGGAYQTTFITSTYTEGNSKGEIVVSCSLQGDVPQVNWASGNGELCRLGFNVSAYGSGVLNIFDTRLYDYLLLSSPAYTYYSNQDGFFYNQPFHDVAVTNAAAQPSIVEPSGSVTVDVTIKNEGNFTETSGTFNVSVYADKAPYEYIYDILGRLIKTNVVIGDEIIVGTKTVATPLAVGATTTLTFTWNTAGVEAPDTYTISAEVKGDSDTRDNILIDGTVALKGHDLSVTGITILTPTVYKGWLATINVTVMNQGNYSQTFDVTVYADINTAVIGDEITVGTQTGHTLSAGATTTLTFNWNTAGASLNATYAISAYVPPVSEEVRVTNNMRTEGTIFVKIPGDVNGDGRVNNTDLIALAGAYGSTSTSGGNWYSECDFNKDNKIEALDLFYLGKNYGKTAGT